MLKGLKTRLFLYSMVLLFVITANLNAGWLEIEILHNNKRYVNNNTINVNIRTHELIAIKFTVHYNNSSMTDEYSCWVRDGYYGSNWYKYQFPDYVDKWENKTTTLLPQKSTTLENIVYIHPTNASSDTVMIWYGEKNKKETTRWQKVIINVDQVDIEHPEIENEPEFTSGTSNKISWYPVEGSFVQDAYYFDDADPSNLRKAAQRLYKNGNNASRTTVFENLEDGHKYGYFARSEVIVENDTLFMCSDITYSVQDNSAPKKVTVIQALNKGDKIELVWKKVSDEISKVEKYVIYRNTASQGEIPVDTVLSSSTEDEILRWVDESLEKGKISFYRVRAVDVVGNIGGGIRSNSVYFSGEEDDRENTDEDDDDGSNENTFGDEYIKGSVDTLWIQLGLENTVQALCFESVRDSSRYFDSEPSSKMRYFSSGWVTPEILRNRGWVSKSDPDKVFFVFDYTDTENAYVDKNGAFQNNSGSEHIDANFVNGRTYIRRILCKYEIAQDTVQLDDRIPDCFAPDDIHNLTGEIVLEESLPEYSKWCMNLSWEPAYDEVTGVKRYYLWRKIEEIEEHFVNIGTATSTEFIDTLNILADYTILNPLVSYKVTSEDYLGNMRAVNESDWEVQERSLQGPEIVFTDSGSDIKLSDDKDTLWTQNDIVAAGINKFNITEVLKYEIDVNGTLQTIRNLNRDTDTLEVDLSGNEVSFIKARAVYIGNVSSLWSNTLIAIRNLNRTPENLQAKIDSVDWNGNIKLSWTRASLDAFGYEIFRDSKKIGEIYNRKEKISWVDKYGMDELKNEPGDTLIGYRDYDYAITAIDVFKDTSDPTDEVTTYCNSAPEVVFYEKKNQNDNYFIRIGWKRVIPSLLKEGDIIKYEVKIYQDSLSNLYRKSEIIYTIDGDEFFEDFRVVSDHNYIFRIRGIPNSYPYKPSAWSRPFTVPDFSLFDSLESFALPGKSIFIYWNNSEIIRKYKIDSFKVVRSADDTQENTWTFPSDILSFVDNSDNLKHGKDYTYTIKAIDSLDQILDEHAVTVTCDSVAFIPDIDSSRTLEYFNQDSLQVFWKWINDKTGEDIELETENADSLLIQLSISSSFPPIADQTVTTDYIKADYNRNKKVRIPELASQKNDPVFIRVTAKDKWGHNAVKIFQDESGNNIVIAPETVVWSSDSYGLRVSVYDTIPSPSVNDFKVKYNGPYNSASDSIKVSCTWSGEGVEKGTVDTNRNIMWNAKLYRIVRELNGEKWIQDEIPVDTTDTMQNYVYQGYTLNRNYQWQINVIDSAGNITQGDTTINAENFLATPPPPDPIDYKVCSIPEIESNDSLEYFIEIAQDPSHFPLAYQDDDLTDRLLCQIGWTVSETCSCTTGWGSIKIDTTWFRLKVRKKAENGHMIESAWSLLAAFMDNSSGNKCLTGIEESNNSILSFNLHPNKPNPFNSTTEIRYEIPEQSDVTISIFNMRGSFVRGFTRSSLSPGSYSVTWDGTDMHKKYVSSGIYICFLTVKTKSGKLWRNETKMLLIK
ncbi:MAG: FlgD immunoglobulin-like domain containing protein [bacterium]